MTPSLYNSYVRKAIASTLQSSGLETIFQSSFFFLPLWAQLHKCYNKSLYFKSFFSLVSALSSINHRAVHVIVPCRPTSRTDIDK